MLDHALAWAVVLNYTGLIHSATYTSLISAGTSISEPMSVTSASGEVMVNVRRRPQSPTQSYCWPL